MANTPDHIIPQQSGMDKKPILRIEPPRKEKAAVCQVAIPMPIEEPSEYKSKYQVVLYKLVFNLRDQELGKLVLGYAIPVTGLLITFANNIVSPLLPIIIISLCVGLVCLWNGMLFRGTILDKLAGRLELIGAVCVLFAFFSVVGSFLPPELVWIVWICFLTFVLPLALSFCHVKEMTLTKENSPI